MERVVRGGISEDQVTMGKEAPDPIHPVSSQEERHREKMPREDRQTERHVCETGSAGTATRQSWREARKEARKDPPLGLSESLALLTPDCRLWPPNCKTVTVCVHITRLWYFATEALGNRCAG